MKKMKVLIRAFCATNFGDDLFIKLLCNRYPDVFSICSVLKSIEMRLIILRT